MNKIELCKKIQSNIYNLCPNEIDELFKILYKNNSTYTQNNNGIFVNLNWIDEEILIEINNYINFCLKSQTEINKYEIMKNLLNSSINNKEKIEDITDNVYKNDIVNNDNITTTAIHVCIKLLLLLIL